MRIIRHCSTGCCRPMSGLPARLRNWALCALAGTTAYQASFEDAQKSLATLRALPGHRFAADDLDAVSLPALTSYKETTDAHLVTLATRHGLKLATLDVALIAKPWAVGIAENPL